MSTRALYSFIGDSPEESWNIYRHHDGYPTGAAETLTVALRYFAWTPPRFEADEFAAAFCAAGKVSTWLESDRGINVDAFNRYGPGGQYSGFRGGGERLMPQGDPMTVASRNCSDIEYRYEIYQDRRTQKVRVRAFSANARDGKGSDKLLFSCAIEDIQKAALKYQKKSRE